MAEMNLEYEGLVVEIVISFKEKGGSSIAISFPLSI